ncbi:MAG: hypothetical protein QXT28_10140 [Thermofilaceae archaeon]
MEGLASSEGRRELRARLEEWVERRGAELQQLFSEYGLSVDARRLLRSAVRDAVFFSLPRSLLEWYGSLIEEVREGLEGAGGEVWDELTFHYSTAVVVRGSTAWVKVGYPPSRLYTAKFRRSLGAEEVVVALAAKRLIPPGEVKVITGEGVSTFQAGSLLEEAVRRAREEALPR